MLNTKQTRELVKAYLAARGQQHIGLNYTNKSSDESKRNLAFSLGFGVVLDESDCRYLRWMTGCKDVKLTTSDRGIDYLRLVGVSFEG